MINTESYSKWSKRVYKRTQFEHIDDDVANLRTTRFEKRENQRAIQKTFLFQLGHLFGFPGYDYKEKMTDQKEKLWTCIATCQVCKKVLNTAKHVPEHAKTQVIISAPLVAICLEKHHNTMSDCNIGVDLEWIEEKV